MDMSTTAGTTPDTRRRDIEVISLVGFAHGTSHFFHLMLPSLFPWLMRDFSLNFTQVGAPMAVFFIVSGVGQALAGFAVDRVGARPVLYAGIALLGLSGVALGVAPSYPMLFLAAVIAGLGNSVFHPADFTVLNRRVSAPRLGHAFSVHGLSGNLGWAAAPVFMAGIAGVAGWRAAAFGAALVAIAALATLRIKRDVLDDAAIVIHADAPAQAAERRAPLGFLQSPAVWMCFAFFLVFTMAFGALQNYAPALLHNVYGLSLPLATSCLTAFMLGGAGGMIVGGYLAAGNNTQDRVIALALTGAALVAVALASGAVPAWSVVALMALMGFGTGIAGPSRDLLVRKAATAGFGKQSFGRVYGFVYSGLDIGLAVAPFVFGRLMDAAQFTQVLVGVALLQGLAILTALRVGARSRRLTVAATVAASHGR